ncbi:MAG TPA: DoxX family protein [Cyclobacteriaceae bacterium]
MWSARIIAAFLLVQTLFYKFTGSAESIEIFKTVGMEPWGRYGVGIIELIASILIIIPSLSWMGGLIAIGLMLGAIGMHLTILGIEVKNDGGQLFIYAVVVLLCSLFVLWQGREKAISFLNKIKG